MRRILLSITFVIATAASVWAQVQAQSPVLYKVTFPEPEHHWMQVEMTFSNLGAKPLDVRMSRSSPGRRGGGIREKRLPG
jgi:hypothetical protein